MLYICYIAPICKESVFVYFSMVLSTGHSDQISLPHIEHVARRGPLIRRVALNSSQRDREMRDVYFESR